MIDGKFVIRGPGLGIFLVSEQSWSRTCPAALPSSYEGLLAAVILMGMETTNVLYSQAGPEGGMCYFASLVMTSLEALQIQV